MKKHLFIASVLFLISVGFFSSCKEKEEEPENPFRENIIGQWKLVHGTVEVDKQNYETDYSEENIIFDFQENNKLIVHGSILNDLGLFDDFQEGERFYNYIRYVANYVSPSSCVQAPRNFSFSHYESGYTSIISEYGLFCNARSDRDSMVIYTTAQIEREINGVVFNGCQFWFYKLN